MKKLFLIIFFWVGIFIAKSQEVYFANIGDGVSNYEAQFGYLNQNAQIFITDIKVDSIKSTNGLIIKAKNHKYKYLCTPDSIGKLTVIVFHKNKDGEPTTSKRSIEIINKPIIKLVVHRAKNILTLNLLDQDNKIVSDEYYSALEIKFIGAEKNKDGLLASWKNKIDLNNFITEEESSTQTISRIIFSTTALYSNKFDLFTGFYSCSIKL